jgi:hypothetical protein
MKLIELHILQSFPVTCLNRDDVGSPKTALFGGVQRARISSQCLKRGIREYAQDNLPEARSSPRAWGWSGRAEEGRGLVRVAPARGRGLKPHVGAEDADGNSR